MLTGPFSVTPTERTTPTLPAVSPVPLLQRVPAVVTIVVLSRLIGAAATVGRCGGGLGESGAGNERGQGQSGDEHFHRTCPCYKPSSGELCISGGQSAVACSCASPSECALSRNHAPEIAALFIAPTRSLRFAVLSHTGPIGIVPVGVVEVAAVLKGGRARRADVAAGSLGVAWRCQRGHGEPQGKHSQTFPQDSHDESPSIYWRWDHCDLHMRSGLF